MQDEFNNRGYSRRNVLRAAGMLTGAALVGRIGGAGSAQAAGITGGAAGQSAADTLRVGVLLPSSTVYPALANEFLAGMQLSFAQPSANGATARPVQLVTQPIGRGHGPMRLQAQALLQQNVSLVVGLLTPTMAARLASLFESKQTVLLASSLGEDLPLAPTSAAVFHHSLQQAQASWALGKWAAQTLGRRAVVASDFASSGYDSLNMFQAGFAAAGGQVLDIVTTHGPQEKYDVNYLLSRVSALRPDLVYAAYCGTPAHELLQAYASQSNARPPLLGGGFLADEALQAGMGQLALGMKNAAVWSATLDTAANNAFINAYRANFGQLPTSLSLLGYESGQLLAAALNASNGATSADRLGPALSATTIAAPRGSVTMDAQMNSTSGSLYLHEIAATNGAFSNASRSQLSALSAAQLSTQGKGQKMSSGWLQSYLSS